MFGFSGRYNPPGLDAGNAQLAEITPSRRAKIEQLTKRLREILDDTERAKQPFAVN